MEYQVKLWSYLCQNVTQDICSVSSALKVFYKVNYILFNKGTKEKFL